MNRNILILIIIALLFSLHYWYNRPAPYGPGVAVPELPIQESTDKEPFLFKDFTFKPLAKFHIRARVLSKENYYIDGSSKLSPTDLAMGWGNLSDKTIIDQLDISQRGRFYYWKPKGNGYPIPKKDIIRSSANMHIIPANDIVEDALSDVREGNIVTIEGYLVEISKPDGWHWKSSTTRNDSGGGACEVIYTEMIKIDE